MKRIAMRMAGLVFAVLIAEGGWTAQARAAQFEPGETFNVPFAFTADGHKVVPGTYEVWRESSENVISIENVKTGKKQLFSVRPEGQAVVPAKGLLVFHGCGNRKDLAEFHVRGTSLYSATMGSGRRKNSDVESCPSSDTTTLAAR